MQTFVSRGSTYIILNLKFGILFPCKKIRDLARKHVSGWSRNQDVGIGLIYQTHISTKS